MKKKANSLLGWATGGFITYVLFLIGNKMVRTDNDLLFALMGSIFLIIILGIIKFHMERNRFTKRDAQKYKDLGEIYNHIGRVEQKVYQLIWIVIATDLILTIVKKGGRIVLAFEKLL